MLHQGEHETDTDVRNDERDNAHSEIGDRVTINNDELEMVYKQNILNHSRNKSYSKIVHDTRNGESKVYGLSDDLIVSVDERKMRYESWAIHDKEENELCAEVHHLLHKWPRANRSKCKYGYETLDIVLTDILDSLRTEDGE